MRGFLVLCASLALFFSVSAARASVSINIDLGSQSMHVESSQGSYDWAISSARHGYFTPDGSFSPTHLELMHYSRKYDNSPMPHAIFFSGGFAIHGTYETRSLGRPASHGCVRLSPANAAALYAMVKAEGAHIVIHGSPPASHAIYASAHHSHHHHLAKAHGAAPAQASASSSPDGFRAFNATSSLFNN